MNKNELIERIKEYNSFQILLAIKKLGEETITGYSD
jgi:hypothetical protein